MRIFENMDGENGTPIPVVQNGSRAIAMPPPARGERDSMRTWKTLGVILGVLVGAGTVAMGIGRAFYVTRDEYNAKERNDVVVGETLKRVGTQLDVQQAALNRLSDKIVEMQIDLTVITKRVRR